MPLHRPPSPPARMTMHGADVGSIAKSVSGSVMLGASDRWNQRHAEQHTPAHGISSASA
jgi:hypothetical protein